jgi:two-component system sensor histidine kinase VicK
LIKPKNGSNERTEIIEGMEIIMQTAIHHHNLTKERLYQCNDHTGPSLIMTNKIMKEAYNNLKNRGIKLRFITEITKDNIRYAKELQKIVGLKHLDNVKGNFAVTESHYGGSANTHEGKEGPFVTQFIVSNASAFVKQQQYFFDMLWEKAIPADQRIKEIEEGIKPDVLEAIKDNQEIKKRFTELIKSSKGEIMLVIPTINEYHRQRNIDIFDLFDQELVDITKTKSSSKVTDGINNNYHLYQSTKYKRIRILLPLNDTIRKDIENNRHIYISNIICFRKIETAIETKSVVLIIDKEQSFVIEINDDKADNHDKAIGFATYSNSRATVLSYVSIFESFWKQSELVKKLKESEELQKDFVHIAAHELRNPIQPILGLSSLLMKARPTDEKEYQKSIKIINKNAKKLLQLASDILDVTKIETNNLILNKQLFNLNDLVSDIFEDYNNQLQDNNKNIKLEYEFIYCNEVACSNNKNEYKKEEQNNEQINKKDTRSVYVFADKIRITEVISNLLNNAIKFTTEEEGIIKIIVERKYDNYEAEKKVLIHIIDSGSGIDSSILPHLFSKFATKSFHGTGLGLFISNNIIKAHGGEIWAKNNNEDGKKGATFGFSLPIANC